MIIKIIKAAALVTNPDTLALLEGIQRADEEQAIRERQHQQELVKNFQIEIDCLNFEVVHQFISVKKGWFCCEECGGLHTRYEGMGLNNSVEIMNIHIGHRYNCVKQLRIIQLQKTLREAGIRLPKHLR